MRKLKFYLSKLLGHRIKLLCLLSVLTVYSLLETYGHAPQPHFRIVFYNCSEAFSHNNNNNHAETESNQIKEFDGMTENSIFFLEVNNALTNFSGRLLCAFESAARHNNNTNIYVILSKHSKIVEIPEFMAGISNVHFVKADFSQLLKGSPVSEIWDGGQIANRKFCVVIASDLIRLVLASKYGGIYMDTDVISVKTLPTNFANFIVAESNDSVVNALFSFKKGHVFLQRALERIADNYRPDEWGHHGPRLFTKLAKELCTEKKSPVGPIHTHDCCCNLTILPPEVAFATPPENWTDLFNYLMVDEIEERLKRGNSFAVHYWNHIRHFHTVLTWGFMLRMETRQPMYKLFTQHCPVTEEKVLRGRLGYPFD